MQEIRQTQVEGNEVFMDPMQAWLGGDGEVEAGTLGFSFFEPQLKTT